ncbi:MAG: HAMP domain-containing histidine kinase [Phycisphaerales bacterium]|nr:HAMP domain-containing histidine kinase [Phycisphaerales bacterium]
MRRVLAIWTPFVAAVAIVLIALAWVTRAALRLDEAQREAQSLAALEESSRLALWRMDFAISPLIAEFAGQPYFAFASFYSPEAAYTGMFREVERGTVLLPSPLLAPTNPLVRLYFQIDPAGTLTSPQAPRAAFESLALDRYVSRPAIEEAVRREEELRARLASLELSAQLPRPEAVDPRSIAMCSTEPRPEPVQQTEAPVYNVSPQTAGPAWSQQQQQQRSASESAARLKGVQVLEDNRRFGNAVYNVVVPEEAPEQVTSGAMRALWVEDALLIARRVQIGDATYVQGAWLDWAAVRAALVESVRDLLPQARLEPLRDGGAADDRARRLAALPVRLDPGAAMVEVEAFSPMRVALGVVWGCVVVAIMAIAALLFGADSLGRRRAAFASAVTHELRSPLTTFRLYSEMLARGSVSDERQRRDYYETLRAEAERLGHLVENVLAYSRLERGRAVGPLEPLRLGELVARVRDRLDERAAGAGMRLDLRIDPAAAEITLQTNASAVEQILFNLVDNACKYARAGGGKAARGDDARASEAAERSAAIVLDACAMGRGAVRIRVRDYGPGIPAGSARRVFGVFHKSSSDAATSAPGVGLGLALSRRLAHGLGGRLRLERDVRPGASFVLELPAGRG